MSCQNINNDKACPAAKLSSSSSICRAIRPDVHGFHHAKTMARDCLARSATCTKRASLAPALLALLPLRRPAAATLRERPVLLLLDEIGDGTKGITNTHTHEAQCDCCSGCQYSRSGCATVDLWERHRPCRLCSLV